MSQIRQSWQVRTACPVSYDIVFCHNLFDPANDALLATDNERGGQRRFVVVDRNVLSHHGEVIDGYFRANGITARIHPFDAGESNKSLTQLMNVMQGLDAFPINRRNEPIIAIGGGVVTDLVGFAASIWRRGVPRINVPTTLMGFVDAAIGVKTGINFNRNKNRLGSFSPPAHVLLDRAFLKTLPQRHLLNGVAEILKLAIVKDDELFSLLEQHGRICVDTQFQDSPSLVILSGAVSSMLAELTPNLFESELARVVDFGHTFSPVLEIQAEMDLLHGEAVLIDMLLSSIISRQRSFLSQSDLERILSLVLSLGLPLAPENLDPDLLMQSLIERQHHRNGVQRVPLPTGIGSSCFVKDISKEEIIQAAAFFHRWRQNNYFCDGQQDHERNFKRLS